MDFYNVLIFLYKIIFRSNNSFITKRELLSFIKDSNIINSIYTDQFIDTNTIHCIDSLLSVILDNITYEDEYEGDFTQRRAIIWTLNFTMKLNFYGPINRQGIIRTTNVNTFSDPALSNKQSSYTATVTPDSAVPGDTIGSIDTFEDF